MIELKELLKTCKMKKHVCPFYDKAEAYVEEDGEAYKIVMFVQKKRKMPEKKDLTKNQKVFEYYKRVKGIREDDKEADKYLFPRFGPAVAELLKRTDGNTLNSFRAMEVMRSWAELHNNLEWNLDTIIKRWYDIEKEIPSFKLTHLTAEEIIILDAKGK